MSNILDIESFSSAPDSTLIEKHFLAVAYNHAAFSRMENNWIIEFLDLPRSPQAFTSLPHRAFYEALLEEALKFSSSIVNDATIVALIQKRIDCAAGFALSVIQGVSVLPLETDIEEWRKIMPIWFSQVKRSKSVQLIEKAKNIVEGGCSIEEVEKAKTLLLDTLDFMSDKQYQAPVHPLEAAKDRALGDKVINKVIKTRLSGFNAALNGGIRLPGCPEGGRLITVAGRPGSGKSTWAMNIAIDIAMSGNKCLYFTLEMSDAEISNRMLSAIDHDFCMQSKGQYPVTYSQITRQALDADQRERIAGLPISAICENFVFATDCYKVTAEQVASRIKLEKSRSDNLSLVVIDYLHLLDFSQSKSATTNDKIGQATRELLLITKNLGVDIILVSQLSRSVESRENKIPVLSDLRDSGAIEQDSDIVVMNYWPYYYDKAKDPYEYVYAIQKNRQGSGGMCNARFSAAHYAMSDRPTLPSIG